MDYNKANIHQLNALLDALHICRESSRRQPLLTVSEISVPILVEVLCALMDLKYEDYIPSQNPDQDVQNIILSLQDRFGMDKFRHLDPDKIAKLDKVQLSFLLQIFKMIFDHQASKNSNSSEDLDSSFDENADNSLDSTVGGVVIHYLDEDSSTCEIENQFGMDEDSEDCDPDPAESGPLSQEKEAVNTLSHSRIEKYPKDTTPPAGQKKQMVFPSKYVPEFEIPKEQDDSHDQSQGIKGNFSHKGIAENCESMQNKHFEVEVINGKKDSKDADLEDVLSREGLLLDLSQKNQHPVNSQLSEKSKTNHPFSGENIKIKEGPHSKKIDFIRDDIEGFIRAKVDAIDGQIALLQDRKRCGDLKKKEKCNVGIPKRNQKANEKRVANPLDQKFPNYPYGIILPRCSNVKIKPSKNLKKRLPFDLNVNTHINVEDIKESVGFIVDNSSSKSTFKTKRQGSMSNRSNIN